MQSAILVQSVRVGNATCDELKVNLNVMKHFRKDV